MNVTALTDIALLASKFINHTNKNIFLTGKAGTGKTTFLKHIVASTHKKTVIAAPTGIAAINAGGVTIHSLFQLPFGSFIPINQPSSAHNQNHKINDPLSVIKNLQMNENKRKLLRELELLIIDEVSMLRSDLLDAIDVVLKHVRRKNYLPFGGVQVLFIGDLMQLPPVVKNEEWELLKDYYKSQHFFDSRVLQHTKPVYIELDKIYRQDDITFISLLNNLRNNTVTNEDIALLNNYYKPDFKTTSKENFITLTTHNYKADSQNKTMLNELKGKSYYFQAEIENEFSEYAYPIEKTLELKIGAQIMFVKNDPTGGQRFFNGKIGIVTKLSDEKIEVQFEDSPVALEVEKYKWEDIKFVLNETTNEIEEKISGTFTQFPIKLAWAITVHKSQGLTFDKAIIDIGDAFAPGQVYVALSRLRSLNGLVLTSHINYNSISEDKKVAEFSKTKSEQENPEELIKKETLLFLRAYLIENFDFIHIVQQLDEHALSYVKDEKRSAKQKHHKWAVNLKEKISEIKPAGDKFINHIVRILDNKESGYLEHAYKRLNDANEYFAPVFKNMSKEIFNKIEAVKSEKKIKTYVEELFEIEVLLYEQIKRMNKAILICKSVTESTSIDRNEFSKFSYDRERNDEILRVLTPVNKEIEEKKKERKQKRERKPREKKDGPKKQKGDTQKETLQLYKQGNTIEEIALERGMAVTTIEGHLSTFIAKGVLNVNDFVPNDKIEAVLKTAKELDTFNLGPIKSVLGDDYSFGEIRMAIASYLAKE
jgi:DNA-binding CsgD family transcriptional regulator